MPGRQVEFFQVMAEIFPVLLCGGSGTRLWPVSRKSFPKHFVPLTGQGTLFQAAAEVGAMAGGADEAGRAALRDYGMELGLAFQLVDDVLDYRGESGAMGKNTGDDLREGKRTVLVTLARESLPATQRLIFDELLGDASLDAEQLGMLQLTIRSSSAVAQVEQMIARNVERAETALDFAPLDATVRERLITLAHKAAKRIA